MFIAMGFFKRLFLPLILLAASTLSAEETPQRIISLTPCATDILGELGIGRELIGVTRYCKPPAESRPKIIGGLLDPSAETVLSLKPDLLIQADIRDKSFLERMAKYGIPYVTLFPENYENIKRDITLLGEKTGRRERAQAVLDEWARTENTIRESLQKKPLLYRPRVLILWGDVCAGRRSYLNDVILLCGGINAAPDDPTRAWPQLSREKLITTRSDLIIYVTPDGPDQLRFSPELADTLKKNPGLAPLPAVRKRQIYRINENSRLLYPSPKLREALPQLAEAIRRRANEELRTLKLKQAL